MAVLHFFPGTPPPFLAQAVVAYPQTDRVLPSHQFLILFYPPLDHRLLTPMLLPPLYQNHPSPTLLD